MANTQKVYFNEAQQRVMFRQAHTCVVIGGRRLGKSHGIVAPFALRNIQRMPGGTHAFVASSFQQAFTRTLPGTIAAWESWGYKRNVHYYINVRPPKSANFKKPIIEPEKYDHIISWYNGSIQPVISQDITGSSNSYTLDSLVCDEGKLLDFQKLKEETFPANGGITKHFGHLPWHHSLLIVSDMPTSKKGSWMLSYEDKMDKEVIQYIDSLIVEKWKIYQKFNTEFAQGIKPNYDVKKRYIRLTDELNKYRRVAVDYNTFSSIENIQLIGEDYIRQMKRDLPPLVFQTSIMCQKVGTLQDSFYNNLSDKHYYSSFDNSYLTNLDYDFSKADDLSCLQDGDLDRNKPLCVAFDFNANINWIVVGQQEENRLNVLKSFFVKYERKLIELVNDFCHYYRHMNKKEVIFYYDSTATKSNYAVNDADFATTIIAQYRKKGWNVVPMYIGNPEYHNIKHKEINLGLRGQKGLVPYFNKDHNEALILAMENTGSYISGNGFKKDKRGEKYGETEEDKLEHRTDGTDAFDTLFLGMTRFPAGSSFSNYLINDFT